MDSIRAVVNHVHCLVNGSVIFINAIDDVFSLTYPLVAQILGNVFVKSSVSYLGGLGLLELSHIWSELLVQVVITNFEESILLIRHVNRVNGHGLGILFEDRLISLGIFEESITNFEFFLNLIRFSNRLCILSATWFLVPKHLGEVSKTSIVILHDCFEAFSHHYVRRCSRGEPLTASCFQWGKLSWMKGLLNILKLSGNGLKCCWFFLKDSLGVNSSTKLSYSLLGVRFFTYAYKLSHRIPGQIPLEVRGRHGW